MRPVLVVFVVSLLAVYPAGCGNYYRQTPAPAASRSPVPLAVQSKPREASEGEREQYAARETRSAGLEKFQGGSAVVTVLVVVLLVIVILILLKKI
jgi:hypothetical protein